jgi:hypothetical protein
MRLTHAPKFPPPSAPAVNTPISSPGLGTLKRKAAALVFPDDEDEVFAVPSVILTKTSVETQFRVSSSKSS